MSFMLLMLIKAENSFKSTTRAMLECIRLHLNVCVYYVRACLWLCDCVYMMNFQVCYTWKSEAVNEFMGSFLLIVWMRFW